MIFSKPGLYPLVVLIVVCLRFAACAQIRENGISNAVPMDPHTDTGDGKLPMVKRSRRKLPAKSFCAWRYVPFEEETRITMHFYLRQDDGWALEGALYPHNDLYWYMIEACGAVGGSFPRDKGTRWTFDVPNYASVECVEAILLKKCEGGPERMVGKLNRDSCYRINEVRELDRPYIY